MPIPTTGSKAAVRSSLSSAFRTNATRHILSAHFQLEAENTLGYLHALRSMIATHGVPLSLYRDRHSIFQRNDSYWTLAEQLAGQQSPTHLGRTLAELGIQQIPAYSPQAKGRVERLWRTCQDRLVSELRLAQAATVEQANAVLATFCNDYNQRFARPAADSARDFRTLPCRFDLARCLSFRYQRIVSPDHVVTLGTEAIALPPRPGQRSYAGTPSNSPINSTARCWSIAATNYPSDELSRFWNMPIIALLHGPPRRNESFRASITSPAAPLWQPLLNRHG